MLSTASGRAWPLPAIVFAIALAPMALPRAEGPEDSRFDREIAPILARRCLDCHSGAEPKGKLDLSRASACFKGGESGPAVVAGKPEESALWERISADEMPPKKPLPAAEKRALQRWIAGGAHWGTDPIDAFAVSTDRRAGRDWWSLQPIQRPAPPQLDDRAGGDSPIDAFVIERLRKNGLDLSRPADRRTLIRRATYDLIGLPPTPERVAAFVNDNRADAYERLVDELLASPDYGVRWARLWLDAARFGESNGFEFDEFRPSAWTYRDWLVNAFNRNLPYDAFVKQQIAGDILAPDDPAAVDATGFLVAGAYDSVGQNQQSAAMRKVVRQDELEDMVSAIGQSFLGLTIHCARCHDHKFDPIHREEYYRLAAALAGVRRGERDLSAIDPEAIAARKRVAELRAKIDAIEAPAFARLAGARRGAALPRPSARWDFRQDAIDRAGGLDASLRESARRLPTGLVVDGKTGYAVSAPLEQDLSEKTLEAWVRLDRLDQKGGGVIGVMNEDGTVFDAIVFAELEPRRWMAGSDGFTRTKSFEAEEENDAQARMIHLAITYSADGEVVGYRDGRPLGKPFKTLAPPVFRAGGARVVFGMRHGLAPGGNRMLAGTIERARLYARALTPQEVELSFAASGESEPPALLAELSERDRVERADLLAAIEREKSAPAWRGRRSYSVLPAEGAIEPTRDLIRGDTRSPGEVVVPGGAAAVVGPAADFGLPADAPDALRRTRLAEWIADRRNPLTPRVIVNRIWQAHFGAGLVETPGDFGYNGGKPSHPELLDWLASEFTAGGWDMKKLHRLIMLSRVYRQCSRRNDAALARDASNRLLWRKSPVRLEAEMVRDAMLAVSGAINPRQGGPGFNEFAISQAPGTPAILYIPSDRDDPEHNRRTLYRTWARGGRNGFLDAFDCPDPSAVAQKRTATTTPLQALSMLNNRVSLRLANRLAERLERERPRSVKDQVDRAYRLAFGRAPDDEENDQAERVVAQAGLAAFARALFNSNEFIYVD